MFGSADYGHADEALNKTISLIADYKAVFCARIGKGVEKELRLKGIKAVEAPYFIQDALKSIYKLIIDIKNLQIRLTDQINRED